MICANLCYLVNWFVYNKKMSKGINSPFISLIPKIPLACKLSIFKPISLASYFYKVIAKILSHKISQVLHQVISPYTNAFVLGQQILDYALSPWFLLKLDFVKAVGSISWASIDEVQPKMGIGAFWQSWTYQCISNASASVLINGKPINQFTLQKGLRQGCPLSPLLFIIAVKGLAQILNIAKAKGLFLGVSSANSQ